MGRDGRKVVISLQSLGREYCENTGLHGFSYWTESAKSKSIFERLFWVVVTLTSLSFAGWIVLNTILAWIAHPSEVVIDSFSSPATDLVYPAITVCRKSRYDAGQYIRAVFNNFQYACKDSLESESCNKTRLLRDHFSTYICSEGSNCLGWKSRFMKILQNWITMLAMPNMATWDSSPYQKFKDLVASLVPYYFRNRFYMAQTIRNQFLIGGLDKGDAWARSIGLVLKSHRTSRSVRPALMTYRCKMPKGDPYEELCIHLSKNRDSWRKIADCYKGQLKRQNKSLEVKFNWVYRTYGTRNITCVDKSGREAKAINAIVARLTDFDLYMLSRYMAQTKTSNLDSSRFKAMFQNEPTKPVLDAYCNLTTLPCMEFESEDLWREMTVAVMHIKFYQRIWFPDKNIGATLAQQLVRDIYTIMSYYTITAVGAGSAVLKPDAWKQLMAPLLGEASLSKVNTDATSSYGGWMPFAHPAFLVENFAARPVLQLEPKEALSYPYGKVDYTFEGLVKTLMFGNYLKAIAKSGGASNWTAAEAELELELGKFPYTRKPKLQKPYFSPVDLSAADDPFHAALTDKGICDVYNGAPLKLTFTGSARTDEMAKALDRRTEMPEMDKIRGTGQTFERVFWMNLKDWSVKGQIQGIPKSRASAQVSFNDWEAYYNVRVNHVTILAGQEVHIVLKPIRHIASEDFKELSIKKRQCLLREELDSQSTLPRYYNQKLCQFECRLRRAINQTGCLHFEYPNPHGNTSLPVCQSLKPNATNEVEDFETAMDGELLDCVHCLPNCEEVDYEVQINTFDLDPKQLCNPQGDWTSIHRVMSDWEKTNSALVHWSNKLGASMFANSPPDGRYVLDGDAFAAVYTNMSYSLPHDEAINVCKERYRFDVAKVTVQIVSPNVMRIKKDVKMSFADQLGVIGGTMGLFTGASIISIVEIGFWLQRALKRAFGCEK